MKGQRKSNEKAILLKYWPNKAVVQKLRATDNGIEKECSHFWESRCEHLQKEEENENSIIQDTETGSILCIFTPVS